MAKVNVGTIRWILVLFLTGWSWMLLPAQHIQVQIDPIEPMAGETFEVKLVLENHEGELLSMPDFGSLSLLAGPNTESSVQLINGKVRMRNAWSFMLRATKAGEYPVSGGRFRVGRQVMSVEEVVISVKNATPTAQTPSVAGDREIFIDTELSTERAYVGQQVVVSWVLYTAIGAESFDILQEPEFDGFHVVELHRIGSRTRNLTFGKRQFQGRLLKSMALFPQKNGQLSVLEARFAVSVPVASMSNDPFSNFFGTPTRQVMLHSPVKTIEVLPLPAPPDAFSGAVGEYFWKISADRTHLTTDEALTLKIEIQGNGDPHRFNLPQLVLPDGLEVFEPVILDEGQYETGDELRHEKIVEVSVLPRQPGAYEIAPEWLYFSPRTEKYESVKLENPLKINVLQGKNVQRLTSDTRARSLSPLRTESHWQPAYHPFWWQRPLFWLLCMLPVVGVLAAFMYLKIRQRATAKLEQSADFQRNKQLLEWQAMLADSQRHQHSGHAVQFYDVIERLLYSYFSRELQLTPSEFSQKNVLERWSAAGATPEDLKALESVWQACELSKYGAHAQPEKMEAVYTWVKNILPKT